MKSRGVRGRGCGGGGEGPGGTVLFMPEII